MMIKAIQLFRKNRSRILELGFIYDWWAEQTPALQKQFDEILRAQIVLTVSAFDTFVHDCVRIGMVRQFTKSGNLSKSLKKYAIPFEDFQIINNLSTFPDKVMYLDGVIKKINSKYSYQSPANVEYALGLLGVSNIWTKVSSMMRIPANDVKAELANIVNRRNKIAHEADMDIFGVSLNPIKKAEVMHVMDFMYGLSISIYQLVKRIDTAHNPSNS